MSAREGDGDGAPARVAVDSDSRLRGASTAARRVLITGISGGIGRLVAHRLLEGEPARWEVIGLARRPFDDVLKSRVEFHQADLRKKRIEDVFRLRRIEAVVHLAFDDDPLVPSKDRYKTNVLGTMKLLDCCEKYGVRKVVVLSTASVYGALADNPTLIAEDTPARADLMHGGFRDRVEADRYAQAWMYRNAKQATTVVLRPVHVLGERVHGSFQSYLRLPVVPTLLGYSPMMQVIHEEDVARAIELALEGDVGGVFNIVGPGAVPLHTILREVGAEALPLPPIGTLGLLDTLSRLRLVPFPPRQADFIRYSLVVSGDKAREQLGFEAQVPLRETLRSASRASARA